ncbi:MAG: sigma-54-dependent transcriptional regulator, partial [Bdellovibrionota bacterium]
MKPRVLIVDDEETIRKLLKARLEREGHDVAVAANADEAQKAFKTGAEVGVLVTDLKMPGKDGFALMAAAKEQYPQLRVIMITGHGEKEVAIKALRQGASDYLEKPFDMDELSHAVKRCLREHQLERDNSDLVGRLEARVERVEGKTEDKLWYVSKAQSMAKVNEWLTVLRREAMRGNAEEPSILILGESGTGKEGIARMVHAGSRRGKGPWVAVNCANFNEQLLESELFGHERGAFTGATNLKRGLFEIAKGGTLFLDEIGEMDVKLQAKLLRVLQEKL